MVAGEFAVLEPHHDSIVMAVNRFVYATLEMSEQNKLTLKNFDLQNISWAYRDNHIQMSCDDARTRFVKDAMEIALKYIEEHDISIQPFSLSIKSELDDESGIKYGLGSSAAVVTAVISIILKKFLPKKATDKIIFKLAAISHIKTQGNGSGADVAASTYGGMIKYSSFQADWLKEAMKESHSLSNLVAMKWPYLSIERMNLPSPHVELCVGWTGNPASTARLVDKILTLKRDQPNVYEQFLTKSDQAVSKFINGLNEQDVSLLYEGMTLNRKALSELGKAANANIETSLLRQLCDLAEQTPGAGKPSGAGGGDCGIAFVSSRDLAIQLKTKWEKAGIKPLELSIDPHGTIEY